MKQKKYFSLITILLLMANVACHEVQSKSIFIYKTAIERPVMEPDVEEPYNGRIQAISILNSVL